MLIVQLLNSVVDITFVAVMRCGMEDCQVMIDGWLQVTLISVSSMKCFSGSVYFSVDRVFSLSELLILITFFSRQYLLVAT